MDTFIKSIIAEKVVVDKNFIEVIFNFISEISLGRLILVGLFVVAGLYFITVIKYGKKKSDEKKSKRNESSSVDDVAGIQGRLFADSFNALQKQLADAGIETIKMMNYIKDSVESLEKKIDNTLEDLEESLNRIEERSKEFKVEEIEMIKETHKEMKELKEIFIAYIFKTCDERSIAILKKMSKDIEKFENKNIREDNEKK